jgi:hypothetical protein
MWMNILVTTRTCRMYTQEQIMKKEMLTYGNAPTDRRFGKALTMALARLIFASVDGYLNISINKN